MNSPYTLTKEQYQELYQEVLLFAKIGGVANDEEGIWKMCLEEHLELFTAIRDMDRIKIVDAICDEFVTFVQLHHYYMSKPTWEQPITSVVLTNKMDLLDELEERNEAVLLSLMHYWLMSAQHHAELCNVNLYKAIKEVNRSNMTKFVPVKNTCIMNYRVTQDALDELAKECEELSKGKYKDIVANIVWDYEQLIVFRENFGNGKICKHFDFYQEPDFTHCLLENTL